MRISFEHHDTCVSLAGDFDGFVGNSPAMRNVYDMIVRAASSEAPVLVLGESGTGKELAAQSLHRHSRRAHAPMVAINCAALPRDMIESELFGYRRGAFTGAVVGHAGILARADGGTLFLDEISEMPQALQAKLLRVIESGRYTPLGSTHEKQVDIRFIAASNREASVLLQDGYLRADLYHRLAGLRLTLPPVRRRGSGDIQRLTFFLLDKIAAESGLAAPSLDDSAFVWMYDHAFSGNVREMENVLRQAVVMHAPTVLTARHLVDVLPEMEASQMPVTLAEAERRHIESAIAFCHGNLTAAARRLGVDTSTLHRKRKTWDGPQSGICVL